MEEQGLSFIYSQKESILAIAHLHGAHNVRIFGSYARGDQKPESDLDLLADIDNDRSLLDQVALIRELEDLLNITVDLVEPACLHWYIKDTILSEAIPL
ncbi:MAG: nucleotidyltransferase family protein [Methanobacteriota archaeon]